MFMELRERPTERMDALVKAVSAAKQDRIYVRHVERFDERAGMGEIIGGV